MSNGFSVPAERVEEDLPATEGVNEPSYRHDLEVSGPVDGDYDVLTLENTKPGYVYFRASASDVHKLKRWGGVEEKWAFDDEGKPTNAYPREWFGEGKQGETVRMRELTVIRLTEAQNRRRVNADPRRWAHQQRIAAMMAPVIAGEGNFSAQQVPIPGQLYPTAGLR